jgi:hypothetical protein
MAAFSITAANVQTSASATIYTGTAGATITQGQPLYLDATSNTYKLANALTNNPIAGVALVGASNGQQMVVCSRDPNFAPGFTIGTGNFVLVGNVAGQLNPVEDRGTGWYVTSLGVGIGGNRLNFSITGSNVAS